jgi:hypothetical protein
MELIEHKNNPDNVRLIISSSTKIRQIRPTLKNIKVQQKMSRLHMAKGGIGSSHSETDLMKLYSFLNLLDLTRTRTQVRRMVKRGAHQERLRYQLDH